MFCTSFTSYFSGSLSSIFSFAPCLQIFVLLLMGAFGLPVPEDLALIYGGVLINRGEADPYIMIIAAYVGIILGDAILYRAGHLAGPALFKRPRMQRLISAERLSWLKKNLEKRNLVTIFLARHLFYLRTVTFLLCGAVRMNFLSFLAADAISALVTAPLMLYIGMIGAEHYDHLVQVLNQVKFLLVGVGVIAAIILFVRYTKCSK